MLRACLSSLVLPTLEAKHHFSIIWDNLPREPIGFFGIPLTKSSYGYGCIVLKRDH